MSFVKKLQGVWILAGNESVEDILDHAVHNHLKEGFTESRTIKKAIGELEELISDCSATIDELKEMET